MFPHEHDLYKILKYGNKWRGTSFAAAQGPQRRSFENNHTRKFDHTTPLWKSQTKCQIMVKLYLIKQLTFRKISLGKNPLKLKNKLSKQLKPTFQYKSKSEKIKWSATKGPYGKGFFLRGEKIDTYFYDYVLSQRRKIKLKVSICPTVDVGVANKTPAHGALIKGINL